jgi:hypothetical protein
VRHRLALLCFVPLLAVSARAQAAEPAPDRALTPDEIETWLSQPSGAPAAESLTPAPDEAPPPPPRRHGLTVESGVGAMMHLGPLRNISPTSPRFQLKVGFEPLKWLMAFAETDLTFSNTSYAHPPPPPRTYHLFGFGAGLRFTLAFAERFGAYLEGSAGLAEVSSDVLEVYGYSHATQLKPYFGGLMGFDWYPLNPRFAFSVSGGARSYQQGLRRQRSSSSALVALGGLALRYTF